MKYYKNNNVLQHKKKYRDIFVSKRFLSIFALREFKTYSQKRAPKYTPLKFTSQKKGRFNVPLGFYKLSSQKKGALMHPFF